MNFYSILYRDPADRPERELPSAPQFFRDLNLDQIVATINIGREEYNLWPFFYAPLADVDAIAYRHEVMQDLEQAALFENIKAFAQGMRGVRDHLAQVEKLRHQHQKHRSFLDAAMTYCGVVTRLASDLASAPIASRGLQTFKEYLTGYTNSPKYIALQQQTKELSDAFSAIVYGILIQGSRVDVRLPQGEPDYSAEVLRTFARFKQDTVQRHKFDFSNAIDVNHIEGQILDLVARTFANEFSKLDTYSADNQKFQDATILEFDREVEFYLAYQEYITPLKRADLSFCYPEVIQDHVEVFD
ncbi:MAG TPA: hypothetical protein VGR45_17735, partial [Stellaceae bacterium]|nr:hypothetical protein [Stellaceae bacterium]